MSLAMRYRTFDDWKKYGFVVEKGQKSHKRNKKGICVFSEDQVLGQEDADDCPEWNEEMFYWDRDDR